MGINYLAWDSDFLNKKIGRIDIDQYETDKLSVLLAIAQKEGYQLIYLFAPESVFLKDEILIPFQGKLVDRKVTYRMEWAEIPDSITNVEKYSSDVLSDDLEQLVYLSGNYSRFFIDKHFASNDFYKLYKTWITESINGNLADCLFAIRESAKIVAMVTLKKDDVKGQIGLLAVSEKHQKKGYGKLLIETCKRFLSDNGIYTLDVPTQLANYSACAFYESCGFKKLSITNIYHFWL